MRPGWRWRISSAAMATRSAHAQGISAVVEQRRSWPRSRHAAPPRSAVMSSIARTAARFASPTTRCRNRHCPKCQGLARSQWLADRQTELLPVPYFHVVFTAARAGRGDRVPEQGGRL